jgi:hypothetical protein
VESIGSIGVESCQVDTTSKLGRIPGMFSPEEPERILAVAKVLEICPLCVLYQDGEHHSQPHSREHFAAFLPHSLLFCSVLRCYLKEMLPHPAWVKPAWVTSSVGDFTSSFLTRYHTPFCVNVTLRDACLRDAL